MSLPCTAAIKEWAAQIRTKLADSDAWTPADFHLDYGQDAFAYSACVPMLAGGDFVGILNFTTGPPARAVTRGQLKMLNTLAGTAAAAMQVTFLLDRLRRTNDELEQRVQQRTAQLEDANQELEAFSYSVSHDLRAPLRAIVGYSGILLQDCRPLLSADSQRQFDAIIAAGHRMGELIDDLLELAHLSRQPLRRARIQPARLVEQVLDELRREHAGREVEIKVSELPDCMGDASLLRQVYVNLLSNAFKFTQQRTAALIEIGAFEQPGERVYFVRDNGAGFDMQHVARLFGVFQRLHGAGEFSGTGIGLSIVQRIVNRHGGRAWAEGEVGKGATFYFSLPNATPAP
jgi:light-regulated signal transduction histidine kinase (bacteriophytochrome)